jgi:hypothetical protein
MSSDPRLELARWQRWALPGGLFEASDGRRSARDWIVDLSMMLIAVGISVALLAMTWDDHEGLTYVLDLVLGAAAFTALWFRRSRPFAVGMLTGLASIVSAAAAGPALIALFNAALRTTWRELAAVSATALASTLVFPLLYATSDPYLTEIVIGVLVTVIVIGWGLFVRARRDLTSRCATAPRVWRRSSGFGSSRRARPSGAGSRARCTTCSPTACRC